MTWDAPAYAEASSHHRALDGWFLARHTPGPFETVIDVGSGSGEFTALLAKHMPNGRVIGVEPDPAMRETAASLAGPRLAFVAGRAQDLDRLDLPPANSILSRAVFHWIPLADYGRCYAAAASVLLPGGWLHAESAGPGNVARLYRVADRLAIGMGLPPAQLSLPEVDEVVSRLVAAGFTVPEGAVSVVGQRRPFTRKGLIDLLRTQVLLAYPVSADERDTLLRGVVDHLDELRDDDGTFAQTFQRLDVLVQKPARNAQRRSHDRRTTVSTPAADRPSRPAPRPEDAHELLPPDKPVQLLGADGVLHEVEGYPLDLKDEDFRNLYRFMVLARRVDKQAINLQRQGQLAVYASLLGQEAAQVGSAYAMAEQDWAFTSYRESAVAMIRGVTPTDIMRFFRSHWFWTDDARESHFAPMCIAIGTQALHAAGFAMGAKFDGKDIVVMSYFGDGATSEGDPHEAMNFAAVYDAPCIFFVQNNQYAISVPLSKQTKAPTIAHKAVGYGMPGFRCDGNDVLATYAVSKMAVDRARRGEGPSLIEAMTYRMEAHTTADDPTRYRTPEELAEWKARDPIARFETFLEKEGLLDDAFRAEIDEEAQGYATRMREEIYDAPHGDPLELFEHVYVDPPPSYEEQKAMLRREIAANEAGGE